MNVLYEDEGAFKVGTVLAESVTSLQVEAPHGKRSKIKAAAVLFRFE
jgi:exoribonuclease II